MDTPLSFLSAQTFRNDHRLRGSESSAQGAALDSTARGNAGASNDSGFAQMFSAARQASSHESWPPASGANTSAAGSKTTSSVAGGGGAHPHTGSAGDEQTKTSAAGGAGHANSDCSDCSQSSANSASSTNPPAAWLPRGWEMHRGMTSTTGTKAEVVDTATTGDAASTAPAGSAAAKSDDTAPDASSLYGAGADAAAAQWLWVGSSWVNASAAGATASADRGSNPTATASTTTDLAGTRERQTMAELLAHAGSDAAQREGSAVVAGAFGANGAEGSLSDSVAIRKAFGRDSGRDGTRAAQTEGGFALMPGAGWSPVDQSLSGSDRSDSGSGRPALAAMSASSASPSTLSSVLAGLTEGAQSGANSTGAGGRNDPGLGAGAFQQMLSALTPQGNTATATVATPVSATVQAPLGSAAFAQDVAVQVTRSALQAGQGTHEVTLHLNPADMGPVSVAIELRGDQARIEFGAAEQQTRHQLEQSLSALSDALQQEGVSLAHSRVHDRVQESQAWGGAGTQAGLQQGGQGQEHPSNRQSQATTGTPGGGTSRGGMTASAPTGLDADPVPLERASAAVRQALPGGLDVFI